MKMGLYWGAILIMHVVWGMHDMRTGNHAGAYDSLMLLIGTGFIALMINEDKK